jgi:general secretion pathway protein D
MALYTGNTMALAMLGNSMSMGMGGGMGGGMGYGGMGGGMGYGGMGYGGMGYGGAGYGGMGYGGMGYGGAGYSGMGYGGMGYGGMGYGGMYQTGGAGGIATPPVSTPTGTNANPTPNAGPNDLTGSYLGAAGYPGGPMGRMPHVIPNPFDNTLLIQGTPQEYEQITHLLRQLDIPPRQVLIDARIYEVDLTGSLQYGVNAFLEQRNSGAAGISRVLNATSGAAGLTLSAGALVLKSHELLGLLTASEITSHSRIVSAPSIIATDSIPAVMNVGQDVPVLTSSGVSPTGSSFNSVSNRSTGVTLAIMARVNSSGVVTMVIDQDVSAPQAAPTAGINSPAFSRRSFQTQLTVQDGDTVAIGGFIQEQHGQTSTGVPVLSRIPLLGAAFGSKGTLSARTELIVFLTPRVIYDNNQMLDATDEIKNSLSHLQKLMRNEK